MQFGMVLWRTYWTPVPLDLETSASRFSEARALRHVQVLANDIGERQVIVVCMCCKATPRGRGVVQQQLLCRCRRLHWTQPLST